MNDVVDWEPVSRERAEAVLKEGGESLLPPSASAAEALVMVLPLPFYPDYDLYLLSSPQAMPPVQHFLLYRPGGPVFLMDGSPAPILEANEESGITLDEDSVFSYLRFYFMSVVPPEGPFLLLEESDDLPFAEQVPQRTRRDAVKAVSALAIEEQTQEALVLSGTFAYREAVIGLRIHVEKESGRVRLSDEDILVSDVPLDFPGWD